MMGNNSFLDIYRKISMASNPEAFLNNEINRISNSNPFLSAMLSGGNFEQIAKNLCRERGLDPDQVASDLLKGLHKR